jgi:hypothetical protein
MRFPQPRLRTLNNSSIKSTTNSTLSSHGLRQQPDRAVAPGIPPPPPPPPRNPSSGDPQPYVLKEGSADEASIKANKKKGLLRTLRRFSAGSQKSEGEHSELMVSTIRREQALREQDEDQDAIQNQHNDNSIDAWKGRVLKPVAIKAELPAGYANYKNHPHTLLNQRTWGRRLSSLDQFFGSLHNFEGKNIGSDGSAHSSASNSYQRVTEGSGTEIEEPVILKVLSIDSGTTEDDKDQSESKKDKAMGTAHMSSNSKGSKNKMDKPNSTKNKKKKVRISTIRPSKTPKASKKSHKTISSETTTESEDVDFCSTPPPIPDWGPSDTGSRTSTTDDDIFNSEDGSSGSSYDYSSRQYETEESVTLDSGDLGGCGAIEPCQVVSSDVYALILELAKEVPSYCVTSTAARNKKSKRSMDRWADRRSGGRPEVGVYKPKLSSQKAQTEQGETP